MAAVGLNEGGPGEELGGEGCGVGLEGEEGREGVDGGEGECVVVVVGFGSGRGGGDGGGCGGERRVRGTRVGGYRCHCWDWGELGMRGCGWTFSEDATAARFQCAEHKAHARAMGSVGQAELSLGFGRALAGCFSPTRLGSSHLM